MANETVKERYPERFEEVLALHGIEWNKYLKNYTIFTSRTSLSICNPYTITGIAIEAMNDVRIDYCDVFNVWRFIWCKDKDSDKYDMYTAGGDKDFCKCVDKAIREVYK